MNTGTKALVFFFTKVGHCHLVFWKPVIIGEVQIHVVTKFFKRSWVYESEDIPSHEQTH